MTGAEFQARYQLLAEVATGAVRTLMARDTRGVLVMAHFLGPASGEGTQRLIAADRLPEAAREVVVERCVVDGNVVLITRMLDGFVDFGTWLRGHGGAEAPVTVARESPTAPPSAAPARPPAPPTAPASVVGGEFTQIFGRPGDTGPVAEPPRSPPTAAPVPRATVERAAPLPPSPPPPAPPAPQAGEFSQLFGAPKVPQPPAAQPAPPAPADAETVRLPTMERSTASPPHPPVAAPVPPATPQGGEFTQLFGAPGGRPAPQAPATPVEPAPVPSRVAPPPAPPAAPPPPPPLPPTPPPPVAGEFTQLFGAPGVTPPPQAQPKPSAAQAPAPPPPPPPAPPPAAPSAPTPAEPPRSGPRIVWKGAAAPPPSPPPARPVAPEPPRPAPAPPPPRALVPPQPAAPLPRPAPPPAPPPRPEAPGEFTQLFGPPSGGSPTATPPRGTPPHAPKPQFGRTGRDYRDALDGLHRPPESRPAPEPPRAPPARQPVEPDFSTDLPPFPREPLSAPPAGGERPPAGPSAGGFTQVVSGRSQAKFGEAAAEPGMGQPVTEVPPGMPRWLVISLVVIGVLAIVLIVAIALF